MTRPDLDGITMSAEMLEASAAHLELQSLRAHYKPMIGGPREVELAVMIRDAVIAMREKYPGAFAGAGFSDELFHLESDAQQVLMRVNGSAAYIQAQLRPTTEGETYSSNP